MWGGVSPATEGGVLSDGAGGTHSAVVPLTSEHCGVLFHQETLIWATLWGRHVHIDTRTLEKLHINIDPKLIPLCD